VVLAVRFTLGIVCWALLGALAGYGIAMTIVRSLGWVRF
jgi:hypothetical protein